MTTLQDNARKCAALIRRPGGWCQGAYTRDKDGVFVGQESSHAYSFCAEGAMWVVEEGDDLRRAFKRIIGSDNIVSWNDAPGRTAEEVAHIFDQIAGDA